MMMCCFDQASQQSHITASQTCLLDLQALPIPSSKLAITQIRTPLLWACGQLKTMLRFPHMSATAAAVMARSTTTRSWRW